jgi:predicted membrane channel-forming protein YqfA (hemolysin III family)
MRYFIWLDFQYGMAAIFLGLIGLVFVYIAWVGYPRRKMVRTLDELENAPKVEKNPVAPFLIFTYVGIVCWSIGYLIYIWAGGINF